MFSIEISSDIANRDEQTRSMALHAEASKLETIARGMRNEADLLEAEMKKRRESKMEQEDLEKNVTPEIYVLAFSGQAMLCLIEAEAFNPWEAGDHLAKAERYARKLDPRRGDPFFFEIDELQDRIMEFIVDSSDFTLKESEEFLSKARDFCERHK